MTDIPLPVLRAHAFVCSSIKHRAEPFLEREDVAQDVLVAQVLAWQKGVLTSSGLALVGARAMADLLRRRGHRMRSGKERTRPLSLDHWGEEDEVWEVADPVTPESVVMPRLEAAEQAYWIGLALAQMGERDRTLARLRWVEGWSVARTAAELGLAKGTVVSRTSKLRRRVREWVERVGGETR